MGDFRYEVIEQTSHRPWPLPDQPWLMTQTWHDVLFAHWPVPPEVIRPLVPRDFALDLYGGQAWVGLVPFDMSNVTVRPLPPVPYLSSFAEVNVRTYVTVGNKPGVYFFSLDAERAMAAAAARHLLHLPYHTAAITVQRDGAAVRYHSDRRGATDGSFSAWYRPTSTAIDTRTDALAHYLTERYCLYHVDHRGRPYRLQIHHPPWPLQRTEAVIACESLLAAAGIERPDARPLFHYAARQDTLFWGPEPIEGVVRERRTHEAGVVAAGPQPPALALVAVNRRRCW